MATNPENYVQSYKHSTVFMESTIIVIIPGMQDCMLSKTAVLPIITKQGFYYIITIIYQVSITMALLMAVNSHTQRLA